MNTKFILSFIFFRMNKSPTQLERLANEIFFEIFEYLDANDLFRALTNLNHRFDGLLLSFNRLTLTLSPKTNNQNFAKESYSHLVNTLIVMNYAEVILDHFPDVRRLILHRLAHNILEKLESDVLPYLEYLSIDSSQSVSLLWRVDLSDKIFTNGFPQLQFCSLHGMNIISAGMQWSLTPSINVLKIGQIDLLIYVQILSVCSNLRLFEFAISPRSRMPNNIAHQYPNVRTLVIWEMAPKNQFFDLCLSCVPNVSRLDIYTRSSAIQRSSIWPESGWFSSNIDRHLSQLRRMNFHLSVILDEKDELEKENRFATLQRDFERAQNNRFQSKLIIDQKHPRNFGNWA